MNITDNIPIWTVLIKHEGKEYKYWCSDYEAVVLLLKVFKKDLPSQGALIIPPSKEEPTTTIP